MVHKYFCDILIDADLQKNFKVVICGKLGHLKYYQHINCRLTADKKKFGMNYTVIPKYLLNKSCSGK